MKQEHWYSRARLVYAIRMADHCSAPEMDFFLFFSVIKFLSQLCPVLKGYWCIVTHLCDFIISYSSIPWRLFIHWAPFSSFPSSLLLLLTLRQHSIPLINAWIRRKSETWEDGGNAPRGRTKVIGWHWRIPGTNSHCSSYKQEQARVKEHADKNMKRSLKQCLFLMILQSMNKTKNENVSIAVMMRRWQEA